MCVIDCFLSQVRKIIAHITGAATMPGDGSFWVLRRHGYTERENPEHLVSVMQGGGPLLPFQKWSALVPQLLEILELLDRAVTECGHRKPKFAGVDVEYAVEPLKALLVPTGLQLMYYPPPSEEEIAMSNRTNPYFTAAERERNMRPVCAACGAEYSRDENMSPLFKCSRCKEEHYCCREHQKAHWKQHKKYCFDASAV